MDFPYFPLPPDYLALWQEQTSFELCIVGKDPYPTNPVGIPFAKASWAEMDYRTSGTYVLEALGIWEEKDRFAAPRDAFLQLGEEGVGFLNASYHYFGKPFAKSKHQALLRQDWVTNGPLLAKSRRILLCGEAKKLPWLLADSSGLVSVVGEKTGLWDRAEAVPHPDVRNRVHPSRGKDWAKIWAPGRLAVYRRRPQREVFREERLHKGGGRR